MAWIQAAELGWGLAAGELITYFYYSLLFMRLD
jgi:hypothetical protein